RARVEPAGPEHAWLVVTGAYAPPRDAAGRPMDVTARRDGAREQARALARALAAELLAAAAPLHGVVAFPALEPAPPRVADVMDVDTPAVDEDLDLHAAASLLEAAGVDGGPVVNASGRLVGVLTERDLLAGVVQPQDSHAPLAGALCRRPALVTVPQLSAARAAQQMLYHGVRRLAVVEDGRLVGMVTRTALFAALRAHAARTAAVTSV
ncbi:MAG TPA: CBS domain-containing protein, partial [Egibacteraceae bacterium]|nr:CBS domain-containing protein [Egibacteraceae bacterium]